jgi:predicted esterase
MTTSVKELEILSQSFNIDMTSQKTRVLCLHGCCQNQEMFTSLLKNCIRLGAKENLEFHFIEGLYDHPDGGKTWYNEPLNVSKIGYIKMDEQLIKEAMDQLSTYIKENGITVLLGFSQGANVVDTYLQTTTDTFIKRAVMLSGYSLVADATTEPVDVSILNIYSDSDTIVPSKFRSINYTNIANITHDKGHKLPTSNPVIRNICKFMSG